MSNETLKPFFADSKSAAARAESYANETLAKVFLPFSDIHWFNLARWQRLREAALSGAIDSSTFFQAIDHLEEDEVGKPMLGKIRGELWWAVNLTLPLARLHDIKQIPLLAYSNEGEKNYYSAITSEFCQTRANHSFLVARALESISRANGFSQEEINQGIIIGLIRDLATPAFGDAAKELDPEVLSEEKGLPRFLDKYDLSSLARFGFKKEEALAVILGRGTLGQLLDIVDKLTYTAVDVYHYAGDPFSETDFGPLGQTIEPIREILRQDYYWANIYREIRLREGQVYFTDPQRLGRFLELRARMHQALYLNPHCRGRQTIFRMLMLPLYSREPNPEFPFNKENLLFYTDHEAEKILNNHWKIAGGGFPLEFVLGILPDYQIISTPDLIPAATKTIEEKGLLPLGAETIRTFDPGTDFQTVDPKDGQIKPYSLVRPEHTQFLGEVAARCHQTVVYYWPERDLLSETWGINLKPLIARLVSEQRQRNNGEIPYYQLS